jgi:hypothetical protein
MNTNIQKGDIEWLVILGAIILLGIGAYAGRLWNNQTPKNPGEGATTTPSETVAPSIADTKGIVSGSLSYPSDHIPEDMGVCAQRIDNLEMTTCTGQIKDSKFQYGVGYELSLDPGNYYVYAFLGSTKAYYTEFVLCGLKAECKSHTKVPVVVTAGSRQDSILPQDWYDVSETPSPTAKPTAKPIVTISKINPGVLKIIPTATPTLVVPKITITRINPGVFELIPTATPTPLSINIPTINVPKFSW